MKWFVLFAMLLTLTSCRGERTRVVLIREGTPVQCLENRRVKARALGQQEIIEREVGGWIMIPPKRWKLIENKLQESLEIEKESEIIRRKRM